MRQNSGQSVVQDARQRPSSSASNKGLNGNGLYASATDIDRAPGPTGKSVGDTKASTKETMNAKDEQTIETTGDVNADTRGGVTPANRTTERSLKREETLENGEPTKRTDRPPSISTSTRGGPKTSKTSTPITTSFPDPPLRARPSRATESTGKRSHKKGAGLAAQLAAAAVAAEEDGGASVQGDDEEEDEDGEPRYCYCDQVSYGEMVACDMERCPREWFHLDCVGLTRAPRGNGRSLSECVLCLVGWLTLVAYSEMVL